MKTLSNYTLLRWKAFFHYYPSHAAQKAQVITQRQSWSVTRAGCLMDSMDQRERKTKTRTERGAKQDLDDLLLRGRNVIN